MTIEYDRQAAKDYAKQWWDKRNPEYVAFDDDCTSFISQVLRAGEAPMTGYNNRGEGWWYAGFIDGYEAWSYSWAVANALRLFLLTSPSRVYGLKANRVSSARDLSIGDVICYDWDGDGTYQHNTVVVGFNRRGSPLVAAHTYNSYRRFWRYRSSPRYSENTTYDFYHIYDVFQLP